MKTLYTEITSNLPSSPLRRFYKLVAGERQVVLRIYLYGIFAGAIGLSLPLGIQAVINLVSAGALTSSWFVLVVVIVGGLALAGILQILQLTIVEGMQQRIFLKSALELSIRIPRLKQIPLRKHYVPELVNRFFDTITVQKGLSKLLLDFSAASLQIAFGLILLSFYHPLFIVFGIGLVITLFIIVRVTAPKGLRTSLQESRHKYEVAHWLEETGRNRELFKAKASGDYALQRTDGLTVRYLGARKSHFKILLSKYVLLLGFKILIIGGLLVLGSRLVVENQLNLGQFVAVEIVTILVISSVEKLVLSVETIYDVLTGLEKIGYITDLPLETEGTGEMEADADGHDIRFDSFCLRFPGESEAELEVGTAQIKQGEKVLLQGGNPQSWHRLTRTLSGDYQSYSGRLSIGGIPVRDWNKDALRARIGIYHGGRSLIDGSLLENATLFSGPIPLSEVAAVAKAIGLDDFVQQETDSWDKQVGPEGIWLPFPIRAKVMLAQLLLAKPKVMLLADFEHALDASTRRLFWEYVREELPRSSVLVLGGRGATEGKGYDQILRFENRSILSKAI